MKIGVNVLVFYDLVSDIKLACRVCTKRLFCFAIEDTSRSEKLTVAYISFYDY